MWGFLKVPRVPKFREGQLSFSAVSDTYRIVEKGNRFYPQVWGKDGSFTGWCWIKDEIEFSRSFELVFKYADPLFSEKEAGELLDKFALTHGEPKTIWESHPSEATK